MAKKPEEPEDGLRSIFRRAIGRSPYEPYTGVSEVRPPKVHHPGPTYSGRDAAELVGISYRQLDYWAQTDVVPPSVHVTGHRRYSYRDLIELQLVKSLLDQGIKLEQVRSALVYLRQELRDELLPSAKLIIAGRSATLVREEDELIDVVNRYAGQGVFNLNLVDLDGVKDEVDSRISAAQIVPEDRTEPA